MPLLSRSMLLFVALITSGLPAFATAADVVFPDKNLDQLIRAILKKKDIEKESISSDDLLQIYFLHGDGREIENLEGLQHCLNLAEVRLADNRIANVSPLAPCVNIQSLDLTANQIEDIQPLAALVKLQYLKLDDNRIHSINAVEKLVALQSLYFDRNGVESLEPLSKLPKLQALYAAGNKITDVSPLTSVRWLASLDLSSNRIVDITPLQPLTELRFTFLMQNQIVDIGPLVSMAEKDAAGDQLFAPFWQLYLAKNPLVATSRDAHFAALRKIGVRLDVEYLRPRSTANGSK